MCEHCTEQKTVNSPARTTAPAAAPPALMCTCPPSGQKHNFLSAHYIEQTILSHYIEHTERPFVQFSAQPVQLYMSLVHCTNSQFTNCKFHNDDCAQCREFSERQLNSSRSDPPLNWNHFLAASKPPTSQLLALIKISKFEQD